MAEERPLRDKQQRFVEEYLVDLNGRQAAIRSGYSPDTATEIAAENLRKPHIQAAIGQRQAVLEAATHVNQAEVIQEYLALAFSDMRHYLTWGPDGIELTPSTDLSDTAAKAVQEVVSTKKTQTRCDKLGNEYTTVEVQTRLKLYNKQAALRDLAEHLNLFGIGKAALDEQFLIGFVEVVKSHASGDDTKQAILGYLRRYLGANAA